MDPVSMIFSAIVAGASAALKPTAEMAVKDGYEALKALIRRKWSTVTLEQIERDPTSEARQTVLKEDLVAQQGLADRDVLEQAKNVLALIAKHDNDSALTAGITIENLKAGANAHIDDIVAAGPVSVRNVTAGQDINVRTVRSGGGSPSNPTRQ